MKMIRLVLDSLNVQLVTRLVFFYINLKLYLWKKKL